MNRLYFAPDDAYISCDSRGGELHRQAHQPASFVDHPQAFPLSWGYPKMDGWFLSWNIPIVRNMDDEWGVALLYQETFMWIIFGFLKERSRTGSISGSPCVVAHARGGALDLRHGCQCQQHHLPGQGLGRGIWCFYWGNMGAGKWEFKICDMWMYLYLIYV